MPQLAPVSGCTLGRVFRAAGRGMDSLLGNGGEVAPPLTLAVPHRKNAPVGTLKSHSSGVAWKKWVSPGKAHVPANPHCNGGDTAVLMSS